jgi:hypothetical protein
MIRTRLIATAWLALAIGMTHAAPERPRYEPPDAPKEAPRFKLDETTWEGQDFVPNYRITFHADGTVTHGYNQRANRGGSWTFDGTNLYFEVNKKYREFKGTVVGDTIKGNSWNVKGKRWDTNLKRVR